MRRSIANKVKRNTTSKLNYMYDNYYDMQTAESERNAQNKYGPFPESEHQKPYENPDDDYQQLENKYTPWGMAPWGDYPTFPTLPKPSQDGCFSYWLKLFGKWVGGVADAVKVAALNEYAKRCKVDFIAKVCCNRGLRMTGVDTLFVNGTTSISYSGGDFNCRYVISVDKGKGGTSFIGGQSGSFTYTAPSSPCYDTITLYPYLSDEGMAKCIVKKVLVKAVECGIATVGFTSQQMATSGTQTLTVNNPTLGTTYSWSVTSGSVAPTTGNSVTYTAPSSNAGCTSNPVITISAGGGVCDTLTLAINAVGGTDVSYVVASGECNFGGACSGAGCPQPGDPISCGTWSAPVYCGAWRALYKCDGTYISANYCVTSGGGSAINYTGNCTTKTSGCDNCQTFNGITSSCTGVTDTRSVAMKAAGCCPAQLL